MREVFRIRSRERGATDQVVTAGETLFLDERERYQLTFRDPCSAEILRAISDLGGEMLGNHIALLGFRNFVGEAHIAGAHVQVRSTKIGEGGVSRLLQDISDLASGLVFSSGAPTRFQARGLHSSVGPIPYHQLQLVRRSMLVEEPGRRLQDWLHVIERSPTRRIERERPVVPIDRVRRLDQKAMGSVFHHFERMSQLPTTSALSANPLARTLEFGVPPSLHFPTRVASPRGKLSFDTPENRFVRHVVDGCLSLIYRFVDHPRLHTGLRTDCRMMLSILENVAAQAFITEASRLSALVTPTQALAKNDGYRDVLGFWMALQDHVSLPMDPQTVLRLLEGRDVATLYEYWVFLKILETVVAVTGRRPERPPQIHRDEFGESIVVGVPSSVTPDVHVRFNPTFTRTKHSAYSTPLRPDVILSVGATNYAFDAKYRLDALPSDDDDDDGGAATYKRADLYKMHTYRDAIHSLRAAFVVYPGTEFKFFDRSTGTISDAAHLDNLDGVGAIPLRPVDADPMAALRTTIERILVSSTSRVPA